LPEILYFDGLPMACGQDVSMGWPSNGKGWRRNNKTWWLGLGLPSLPSSWHQSSTELGSGRSASVSIPALFLSLAYACYYTRWKYTLHINIDANFRQILFHRARNAFNPPVIDGQAYVVGLAAYRKYLADNSDYEEVWGPPFGISSR
jgi:hypothetical protein